MKLPNSNWKFDDSVVKVFDEHVRQSVPMYDEIHSLITDISGWYLKENMNVYDIGTSTGKVIENLINKYETNVNYIGLDNSPSMIKNLKSSNINAEFLNVDVTSDFKFKEACLITSVLTLQFIKENKRLDLLKKINNDLTEGGAFILVEKIIGSNSRFNEIYTELYHELKLKNGLSPEHVFAKSKAIRGVMKPYSVDENMKLLKDSGFKDVDIFFKWNNFVGFIAVK